jgi:hypothetical protein
MLPDLHTDVARFRLALCAAGPDEAARLAAALIPRLDADALRAVPGSASAAAERALHRWREGSDPSGRPAAMRAREARHASLGLIHGVLVQGSHLAVFLASHPDRSGVAIPLSPEGTPVTFTLPSP